MAHAHRLDLRIPQAQDRERASARHSPRDLSLRSGRAEDGRQSAGGDCNRDRFSMPGNLGAERCEEDRCGAVA